VKRVEGRIMCGAVMSVRRQNEKCGRGKWFNLRGFCFKKRREGMSATA